MKYSDPSLPGATLTIPPGAVSDPSSIRIGRCSDLVGSEEIAVGPCVRFLPDDLLINAPVTLTIPYNPQLVTELSLLSVKSFHYATPSEIPLAQLGPNAGAMTISLSVTHLGNYQAIVHVPTPPPPTKNIDILFLVDNSPSMTSKQKVLVSNIGTLLSMLDAAGANYHIGIATSDIGSDLAPGQPWGGNIGKCDTYEGDDGVLQAVACDSRTDVTSDARNACNSLCPDHKFVPSDGHRFISKTDGVTNVPVAMELDPMSGKMVDRGPLHAFQCMALVGDSGCGIEAPLEGSKRALDGHRSENSDFLRNNSVLAVVYLTDEDDCSVQLARRDQNNPVTRDCDPTQPDSYDCYNIDFRCLARSVQCNETTLAPGVKTGCKERPSNYLEQVDKYYKFFNAVRAPDRLLIRGIWTQPAIQNGGRLEVAFSAAGLMTPFLNRSARGASCIYAGDANLFGQAQYRLSAFAKLFGKDKAGLPNAVEASICDIDNYKTELGQLGQAIISKLSL